MRSERLPNGIEAVYIPTDAKTTTILLSVGEGAIHDSDERNGETHLLEHLFFSPRRSGLQDKNILGRIERMGGAFNAHVRKEYSTYWIDCLPSHAAEAIQLLASLITNHSWSEKDIARESEIMHDEYSAYQTDYPLILSDQLEQAAIQGPLGRSLFGTFSGLPDLSPELFAARAKRHWEQAAVRVYIVGSGTDAVAQTIQEHFGTLVRESSLSKESPSLWREQLPDLVEFSQEGEGAETYLAWLLPLPRIGQDMDMLLAYVFGGMSNSRIARLSREAGLGYDISAHAAAYSTISYLYIQTAIPAGKEQQAREVIEDAISSYGTMPLTPEEFASAKALLEADMMRNMGSAIEIAESYAHDDTVDYAHGSPGQRTEAIQDISFESVAGLARDIAQGERVCGVLRAK